MRTYLFGEFDSSDRLLAAVSALRESGLGEVDFHSPYPLHGGEEALGLRKSKVPLIALAGGLFGATFGYTMQFFLNAVAYRINVGGRPMHAPLTFVPVTFELAVLIAAFSIFFGLLALMRLPRPHHPAFEVAGFASASTHAFWVSLELKDGAERARAEELLQRLGATQVCQVEDAS